MLVMVVGGNGQLGAACCAELAERGVPVRTSVRDPARAPTAVARDVEVVTLDVTAGAAQRKAALDGVDVLVLSANAVVPRAGDSPADFEAGVAALVEDAAAVGVRRVVLPSIPVTPVDDQVPFAAARHALEQAMARLSLERRVLRFPPFMESWLALVGSSLPLRGEPHATIGRPSPFLQRFRRMTGSLVESRGVMLVPGPPSHRHAFISVRDAARACVEAALRDEGGAESVEVAGPEILSWREVASVYERVLERRVRVLSTPAGVYAVAARLLGPIADTPSRTMALNRLMAVCETAWASAGGGLVDPATMTTVEGFLRAKNALPDDSLAVP